MDDYEQLHTILIKGTELKVFLYIYMYALFECVLQIIEHYPAEWYPLN